MKELSWAQKNPKARKLIRKCYRENNKEKCSLATKAWKNKNIEKYREYQKIYNSKPEAHQKQMIRQQSRRLAVKLNIPYECVKCGSSDNIHLHHHTYTKNVEDWDYLCQPHHMEIHGEIKCEE